MRRVDYNVRSFSLLTHQDLNRKSKEEIEDYQLKIKARQQFLKSEYKAKFPGFDLAKTSTKSGKFQNKTEIGTILGGAGFYAYDPSGVALVAYACFTIPVVISTKISNRKTGKKAKDVQKDIIEIDKEYSRMEEYHGIAQQIIETRFGS